MHASPLHVIDQAFPLLFQADTNRLRTIAAVLAPMHDHERDFLTANPELLGVRCEAYLAGVAPEWFAEHDYLSAKDRSILGAIVRGTLARFAA